MAKPIRRQILGNDIAITIGSKVLGGYPWEVKRSDGTFLVRGVTPKRGDAEFTATERAREVLSGVDDAREAAAGKPVNDGAAKEPVNDGSTPVKPPATVSRSASATGITITDPVAVVLAAIEAEFNVHIEQYRVKSHTQTDAAEHIEHWLAGGVLHKILTQVAEWDGVSGDALFNGFTKLRRDVANDIFLAVNAHNNQRPDVAAWQRKTDPFLERAEAVIRELEEAYRKRSAPTLDPIRPEVLTDEWSLGRYDQHEPELALAMGANAPLSPPLPVQAYTATIPPPAQPTAGTVNVVVDPPQPNTLELSLPPLPVGGYVAELRMNGEVLMTGTVNVAPSSVARVDVGPGEEFEGASVDAFVGGLLSSCSIADAQRVPSIQIPRLEGFTLPDFSGMTPSAVNFEFASRVFSLYAAYLGHCAQAEEFAGLGDMEAAAMTDQTAREAYARIPAWAQ